MNRPGESVLESVRLDKAVYLLASNSPRRRQLLALTGWSFSVNPADVDETPLAGEKPRDHVLRLAQSKARALLPLAQGYSWIIAADTVVVDGENILGKPEDAAQAIAVLQRLRGRTHQVYTGLALLRPSDGALLTDVCATQVPMRNYSDEEIRTYVASGDPLDKAGAYAIQHAGFHPVETMRGCYANVVGLPLCHLTRLLRRLKAEPPVNIPAACQAAVVYQCPVFREILG